MAKGRQRKVSSQRPVDHPDRQSAQGARGKFVRIGGGRIVSVTPKPAVMLLVAVTVAKPLCWQTGFPWYGDPLPA
jgi:hypothetical protein